MTAEELQELTRRMKLASAKLQLHTNEDQPTTGMMNVYSTPPGRSPGTIDAMWGDVPPSVDEGYPNMHGTGVEREAKDVRMGVLGRVFDSLNSASAVAKAEMAQNFEHAKDDDYESHSALLTKKGSDSLADKVRGISGERYRRRSA